MDRVDDLGGRCTQLAALFGSAGLHDDRMALRHPRHIQRPSNLEKPPVMIEHMHFRFVKY